MIRIDTDRFIVCEECCEADHFGNVSIAYARAKAKECGWKTRDGEPICSGCQVDQSDDGEK